jgi:hypothetical protein
MCLLTAVERTQFQNRFLVCYVTSQPANWTHCRRPLSPGDVRGRAWVTIQEFLVGSGEVEGGWVCVQDWVCDSG